MRGLPGRVPDRRVGTDASAICPSRSMTCRAHRTKSPAGMSPSTVCRAGQDFRQRLAAGPPEDRPDEAEVRFAGQLEAGRVPRRPTARPTGPRWRRSRRRPARTAPTRVPRLATSLVDDDRDGAGQFGRRQAGPDVACGCTRRPADRHSVQIRASIRPASVTPPAASQVAALGQHRADLVEHARQRAGTARHLVPQRMRCPGSAASAAPPSGRGPPGPGTSGTGACATRGAAGRARRSSAAARRGRAGRRRSPSTCAGPQARGQVAALGR